MKGDFTRVTFDPLRHFSRVLMQQGRVQLDADWNEQIAIHLHYLRRLAADLIGAHGGPGDGFKIDAANQNKNFLIHSGRYYVDGILCENEEDGQPVSYLAQPNYPVPEKEQLTGEKDGRYLVYLDVWERPVSAIQDDSIREVALGGPDTAIRAKVVWQARALKLGIGEPPAALDIETFLNQKLNPPSAPRLAARSLRPETSDDPCNISPENRYRGPENQLYRVEVHKGGTAGSNGATFKWSRDNGVAVFAIRRFRGETVILEDLGRDARFGLSVGDWVEIVDDDSVLSASATPLYRIHEIDPLAMAVTLEAGPPQTIGKTPQKHPLLRRWDQKVAPEIKLPDDTVLKTEGAVPVEEDKWIPLEDGVEVRFAKATPPSIYATGDYWLIPARTATGDVEWPGPVDAPEFVPPHGIEHRYAPLASIAVAANGAVTLGVHYRRTFAPAAQAPRAVQPRPQPQKRTPRR